MDSRWSLAIHGGAGTILRENLSPDQRRTYEAGLNERAVVIEFDSLAQAIATYEGADYQAACRLLAGAVERDMRFLEGTP